MKLLPRQILGRNVVRLRAQMGYTQEQFAEFAEMDRRYVQRIEAGTANPGVDILERMRRVFRCTWDDLLDVPKKQ